MNKITLSDKHNNNISEIKDNIWFLRKEDDQLDRGIWERKIYLPDWNKITSICVESLGKNRNLWIGARLLEAWINTNQFVGLLEGVNLIHLIIKKPYSPTDQEEREVIFRWIDERSWKSLINQTASKNILEDILTILNKSKINLNFLRDFIEKLKKKES